MRVNRLQLQPLKEGKNHNARHGRDYIQRKIICKCGFKEEAKREKRKQVTMKGQQDKVCNRTEELGVLQRRPEEMREHTSSHSQGRRKGGCVKQFAIFVTIGMSNPESVG